MRTTVEMWRKGAMLSLRRYNRALFPLLCLLYGLLPFSPLRAGTASGFALPSGVVGSAVQRDAAGNLYVAGSITPSQPKSKADTTDVYVAKLSPDGSTVIWSTVLSGSGSDAAAALTIAASGAVYLTGTTASPDFPVSASAIQSSFQGSPSFPTQAFLASLDAEGNLQNATFLGGASNTGGYNVILSPAGAVIATGYSYPGFVTTANTAPFASGTYLIETDPSLSHLVFASSVGGQLIALDSTGNIYIAGTGAGGPAGPMTAGAFQTQAHLMGCGGSIFVGIACSYQYVAKVNPNATNLIYATFLDGTYGSSPSRLTVDAQGNAILAGSTYSSDYPTTAGSFQTVYVASAPHPPITQNTRFEMFPPPQTGYVTKLNPQGTGLIFSTFLGGANTDAVTDLATGSDGFLYLTEFTQSTDFPGVSGVPAPCFPEFFVTRLTSDGAALAATFAFPANFLCPNCSPSTQTASLLLDTQNNPTLLVGSRAVAGANLKATTPPVACILDSADLQPISAIAPGQLLSVFGNSLGIGAGNATLATGGLFPTSAGSFKTTVNGVPAPILYYSQEQINLQAPYELAGSTTAQLQFLGSEASTGIGQTGSSTQNVSLAAASSSPSLFLRAIPELICNGFGGTFGGTPGGGQSPLAFNADGSLNSCANPAAPGSTISVYLNGLGAVRPPQATGAVTTSSVPLSIPLSVAVITETNSSGAAQEIKANSVPGSIDSVWQAKIQLPAAGGTSVLLALSAGGVPFREQQAVIWTKAQ